MTPDQILLVQTSFEMVGADGRALASMLRGRLVDREPALPRRIAATPGQQARLLARLLVCAIRGLGRARALRPVSSRLGQKRLLEHEVAAIGSALVESVEELLGARLPRSVREAWLAGCRVQTHRLGMAACS